MKLILLLTFITVMATSIYSPICTIAKKLEAHRNYQDSLFAEALPFYAIEDGEIKF